MALWNSLRLRFPPSGQANTPYRRRRSVHRQRALLQWAIVLAVGLGLGLVAVAVVVLPRNLAPLVAVAVLAPFVAMMVGQVRRLLLAVVILDIVFQLDTYLFYRESLAELGTLGGLNVSLATLALIGLYVLWMVDALAQKETRQPDWLRSLLLPTPYLALVVLSSLVATDATLSLFEIFLLAQAFLIFVYLVGNVRTREDLLFVVSILFLGLSLESLIMIGLWVRGEGMEIANVLFRVDPDRRVGGTVGSPNEAAAYISLLLTPAFALWMTRAGRLQKFLAALAFMLGGAALILTLSRGGWMAFAISFTLFSVLAWYRGWLSPKIPLALGGGTLLLLLPFWRLILERLFGDDNGSALARLPLARIALRMAREHPWLGVGANNFARVLPPYLTPEFKQEWIYTVHTKYLLVLAETGPAALLAFLAFLVGTLYRGWRAWMRRDRIVSPLALAFAAALLGQMVHMSVDIFNGRAQVQMLWLVAGLLAAMDRLTAQAPEQAPVGGPLAHRSPTRQEMERIFYGTSS